jgi:plasmid maintenance system antidote protein VapI
MTQYDRIQSGAATPEQIAFEITAAAELKTLASIKNYRRNPGHVLVEEFLVPYFPAQLSDLSKRARIPFRRLQLLIRGEDRIDAKMAKSLGDFYGNGSDYWLSLQETYEKGVSL